MCLPRREIYLFDDDDNNNNEGVDVKKTALEMREVDHLPFRKNLYKRSATRGRTCPCPVD